MVVPLSLWISLVTACLVISLTPGAGAINTMSNSLAVGWRRSGWGVLGQQLALVAHVIIVAAGVGVIVQRSPLIFEIIRYAGAAYLAYLGLRMFFAPVKAEQPVPVPAGAAGADPHEMTAGTPAPAPAAPASSPAGMISRGFWVNMLNPKAILFFLAFLPQFIVPGEPIARQYLFLITTVMAIDTVVMWGFFAGAAQPFQRFSRTARGERTMNRVFGALFIAVAGLLLFIR